MPYRLVDRAIGTGRACALLHGTPIRIAMQRTKKYRTGGGSSAYYLRATKPDHRLFADDKVMMRQCDRGCQGHDFFRLRHCSILFIPSLHRAIKMENPISKPESFGPIRISVLCVALVFVLATFWLITTDLINQILMISVGCLFVGIVEWIKYFLRTRNKSNLTDEAILVKKYPWYIYIVVNTVDTIGFRKRLAFCLNQPDTRSLTVAVDRVRVGVLRVRC